MWQVLQCSEDQKVFIPLPDFTISARVGKIGQAQQIWHVYHCVSMQAMDCIHCLGLRALPRSRAKWSPLKATNSGVSTWHCKASGSVKTWKHENMKTWKYNFSILQHVWADSCDFCNTLQRHTAYHCTVSHNCSCFSTCIEVTKHAVFEIQKKRPLAATRVAASGRKWPLGQVAARGGKWPHVAASGRTWPHVGFEISKAAPLASFASFAATCSHLQPLAGTCSQQMAARASGRKWPQVAASGRTLDLKFPKQRHLHHLHHLQPLAATCRNLQPANGC